MKNEDQPIGSRDDLIQISIRFLREVKDMTPGAEMEEWLNEKYGEESQLYRNLARLIRAGVAEGWAANLEISGPNYRRGRILLKLHNGGHEVKQEEIDAISAFFFVNAL